MKRSEINQVVREAEQFMNQRLFALPPWASWSEEQWRKTEREKVGEVVDNGLGWDLTDFGSGTFSDMGLLLFTIRNGKPGDQHRTYAEKIMVVQEGQVTPMHFHWHKTEDIIVRGGGNLVVELFASDAGEAPLSDPVAVRTDGVLRTVDAGEPIILSPGESITLLPRLYHRFYGAEGTGTVLVGEVSSVNDDKSDNRFWDPVGRFPEIEEDEPAYRLLVTDYDVVGTKA